MLGDQGAAEGAKICTGDIALMKFFRRRCCAAGFHLKPQAQVAVSSHTVLWEEHCTSIQRHLQLSQQST